MRSGRFFSLFKRGHRLTTLLMLLTKLKNLYTIKTYCIFINGHSIIISEVVDANSVLS